MKRKGKIAVALAVVLLAVGVGGYFTLQNVNAADKKDVPVNEREYPITKGDITVGIDGVGKIEVESKKYTLPKEIAVSGTHVKEGDWVTAGQTLMEISGQELQKYRDLLEEKKKAIDDKLEDLEDDREDFLDSMNWQLENAKENSSDRYYDKLWSLENRIDEIDSELSEAKWKRDYVSDDDLTRDTVERLGKELAEKQAERDKHKSDREAEKERENDPAYQKSLQDEKLREWDEKIASCKKEAEAIGQQLDKANSTTITAEKDGVVIKVKTTAGEEAVIEIGQREDIVLKLAIEPEDIVDVAEGQEAEFSVDAYPDKIVRGKVIKRILTPDSNGKFAAVVSIEKEEGDEAEILPGMSASGVLVVKQKKDILTLPNKAIILRDGKQYIQVRNSEGELEEKEITTGFSDGKLTEVVSGAAEGDIAITQVTI